MPSSSDRSRGSPPSGGSSNDSAYETTADFFAAARAEKAKIRDIPEQRRELRDEPRRPPGDGPSSNTGSPEANTPKPQSPADENCRTQARPYSPHSDLWSRLMEAWNKLIVSGIVLLGLGILFCVYMACVWIGNLGTVNGGLARTHMVLEHCDETGTPLLSDVCHFVSAILPAPQVLPDNEDPKWWASKPKLDIHASVLNRIVLTIQGSPESAPADEWSISLDKAIENLAQKAHDTVQDISSHYKRAKQSPIQPPGTVKSLLASIGLSRSPQSRIKHSCKVLRVKFEAILAQRLQDIRDLHTKPLDELHNTVCSLRQDALDKKRQQSLRLQELEASSWFPWRRAPKDKAEQVSKAKEELHQLSDAEKRARVGCRVGKLTSDEVKRLVGSMDAERGWLEHKRQALRKLARANHIEDWHKAEGEIVKMMTDYLDKMKDWYRFSQ